KVSSGVPDTPPPVVDLSFLRQQTRDNTDFIREMISYFSKHNPEDVAQLETAIKNADYEGVHKITHRLRSTILLFGLQKTIGAQLEQMEQLAEAHSGIAKIDE